MSDRHIRITATITYDGRRDFPWLQSGMLLKFRLDSMPRGAFLPNMGTEIDGVIQHGCRGSAKIDLVSDGATFPLLVADSTFTLHDSPTEVIAHGTVTSVDLAVTEPLSDEAYGTR